MRWFAVFIFFPVCTLALANDSPQALQEAFMTALRANDIEGLAACYTDDATNFPIASMAGMGPDSVRASWNGFFAEYRVVDARLSQKNMEVSGDIAVAWGLFTIMAEPAGGGELVEMQGRYMDVSKSMDGQWLYIADHASMPLPAEDE